MCEYNILKWNKRQFILEPSVNGHVQGADFGQIYVHTS